jgi:hypothetical protein
MKKFFILFVLCSLFVVNNICAQKHFSSTALIGYGSSKGEIFYDSETQKTMGGGLVLGADLLYHLPSLDNKLGIGIIYNLSIIFGGSSSETSVGGGIFTLEMYGFKGRYQFLDRKVSPYAGLALGLSNFNTLGISVFGYAPSMGVKNSLSLGLMPEIGLELGMISLSLSYFVPMKYEIWDETRKTAGVLQFNLASRMKFNL